MLEAIRNRRTAKGREREVLDIVIIDDDRIVRQGIIQLIDWKSIGCEIVGEASNGRAGFQLIKELHPQIAIVDIKMPVMSGLELTRILKETAPEVEILILTGYSEFDYAREALRLGVKNYLLKPVKPDEIVENVLQVKQKIEEEQKVRQQMEEKQKIMTGNIQMLTTYFLQQVIAGDILNSDEYFRRANELKLVFRGPKYQVMVIDIDDYSAIVPSNSNEQLKKLHENLSQLFDKLFGEKYGTKSFFTHNNELCAILNTESARAEEVLEDCRALQKKTKILLNTSVTIALGDLQENVNGIPDSFTKAMTSLKMKGYQEEGAIIEFSRVDIPGKSMNIDLKEEEHMLSDSLRGLDEKRAKELIDQIFRKIRERGMSYEQVKNMAVRQVIVSLQEVESNGLDFQDILGRNASILDELNNCRIMNDIQIWMREFMEKLIQQLKAMKNYSYSSVVATAIQYIADNYQQEIRVEQIADLVYVTPNYFSRIFYQETGVHFVDYLNQYRLKKAKLLLQDKKRKTYEIAELCGYQNYKYFSFIFKKYEKCSPRQYRENLERKHL